MNVSFILKNANLKSNALRTTNNVSIIHDSQNVVVKGHSQE